MIRNTNGNTGRTSSLWPLIVVLVFIGLVPVRCKKFDVSQVVIVKTVGVSEVTTSSCRAAGTLVDVGPEGVNEHGFCWSLTQDYAQAIDCKPQGSRTERGSFNDIIEGFAPGTTYYIFAFAENEDGRKYGDPVSFTTLSPLAPGVETGALQEVTPTSVTCEYSVFADGGSPVTARGLAWSTEPAPSLDNHIVDGTGTGTFTSTVTGLVPETEYHLWAYATNEVGTNFGEDRTFSTPPQTGLPEVETGMVSEVTPTTAIVEYNVLSDGGSPVIEKGVAWSTQSEPNLENHAADGEGTGIDTVLITGLTPDTPYYAWAYATNANGTAFGNEVTFGTPGETGVPIVHTDPIEIVGEFDIYVTGSITSDGGSMIIDKGFCWSLEPVPTMDNFSVVVGTGPGNFEFTIAELLPVTTYYIRAFATNANGIGYGEERSATTLDACGQPFVDERNGHVYPTVRIGEQCWMAANLDFGQQIPSSEIPSDNASPEKYCYDDDGANCEAYGGLYYWEEMMQYNFTEGSQGVCPDGWHIPSDEEWKILEMELGMTREQADAIMTRGTNEGGKLKAPGTDLWDEPNAGATNESGFTALPAGFYENGNYSLIRGATVYWTSSTEVDTTFWFRMLTKDIETVIRQKSTSESRAVSVRCLKD
jgi:uncharacterized protein (TIGR02145 family)